jgi:uncharacterized protein (TIGR04141 family)
MTNLGIAVGTASLPATALLASTVELSVRLLQNGVQPADALKSGHGLQVHPSPIGTLFYHTTQQEPPEWADFLERGAPGIKARLNSQHSSAVLLLEGGPAGARRLFAFCFGQGHHSIEQDLIERQFGIRVVLNSVSRGDLRVLDSASLDSTVIQRRTQASRESDLKDFGVDIHRELLRLASGTPTDSTIAKAVTGKDALQMRKKLAFHELPDLCERLLNLYNATDYLRDFDFIDQIKPLYKGALTDVLDGLLFADLRQLVAGGSSDLHLAVPDILPTGTGSQLSYFGAHLPRKKQMFDSLSIVDYVAELIAGDFAAITSIADIRSSHHVRSRNDDPSAPHGQLKVYDCMVFETQHNNKQFVLFDGQWYEIGNTYFQEIEQYYQSLRRSAFLASSTAENEQGLIAELCEPSHPDLLCIDKTKLNPGGVTGANLEACDFLSRSKQLIHLKDSETSSPLSHLWNQGLVSAETLKRDSTFRSGFRRVVREREKEHGRNGFLAQVPSVTRIVPSNYTVVFGVLKKRGARSGNLNIPFFSKVALRAAADRIGLMGYNVELHLIEKC